MYWNPKKWIPMLFATKLSFKFPALATPNEVDRVMIDWWRMTSLQEYLKALCLCLLDDRIALPTSICLFLVEENSSPLLKQQLSKLEGFRDSWLDVTTHSETHNHCHIVGTQTPYLSRPPAPTRSMLFTNRKSALARSSDKLCFPTLNGGKGVCVCQRLMTLIADPFLHWLSVNFIGRGWSGNFKARF